MGEYCSVHWMSQAQTLVLHFISTSSAVPWFLVVGLFCKLSWRTIIPIEHHIKRHWLFQWYDMYSFTIIHSRDCLC